LVARLGDFACFLRHPGPFKLVSNGQHQFWDRWQNAPPSKERIP
jgi:hypothetical protein